MKLDIIHIGDPRLRAVATALDIKQICSEKVQIFIDDLIETMHAADGAGLSAPQVAVPWRIFVVEVKDNPRYPYMPDIPLTVLINPRVELLTEERFENFEGCLSVPNLRGVVERCPQIRISAFGRNGELVEISTQGISAGTFQHEFDHLDGLLFIDKVKDTKTLCTVDEFKKHHAYNARKHAEELIARYGA